MKQIAIFSDIHANLPALQSVLKDMDERGLKQRYCLGDLVGYGTYPNEVIALIRNQQIPTIMGNYDQGVGNSSDECGCAYKTEKDQDMGKISISYTNSLVKPEERKYLRTLPAHIRVEFQLNNDKLNLLLVHGSPRKINEYLFEDRDEKSLLRIMEGADADIMCFGHTHKPYHRVLPTDPGENPHYRHAINIGSVGKPKDGTPQGCYVLLTIHAESSIANRDAVQVEFIRFDYDVEKAARAVEESPLPNDYADMLRKGY